MNNKPELTGAPKVDLLNTEITSNTTQKSTIGVRKVQPKRGVNTHYSIPYIWVEYTTIFN